MEWLVVYGKWVGIYDGVIDGGFIVGWLEYGYDRGFWGMFGGCNGKFCGIWG